MSHYNDTAEAIRRFLVPLRPLIEAAERMDALGALDNQAESLEGRAAKASAQIEELTPLLEQANAQVQAARDEAMQIAAAAETKARGILAEADRKAQEKTAAATVEADRIAAEAGKQAALLESRAKAATDAATADVRAARGQVQQAQADLAAAKGELDDINRKLAAAKERMAELLK